MVESRTPLPVKEVNELFRTLILPGEGYGLKLTEKRGVMLSGLAHRQWIEIRGRVSIMGRGEEVGTRRQTAQIESNREVRVKSLHICDSTTGCFF
jgi:hypothetical protein